MKLINKSLFNARSTALAAVVLFSLTCYVCILHLNNPTAMKEDQLQKNEVVLPEAEMMKSMMNKAKDLFSVVTKTTSL